MPNPPESDDDIDRSAASDSVDLLLHDLGDAAPDASDAERRAHQAARHAPRSGGGRSVLVVDSVPIARKFLMQRLQGLGYDVHGAENGARALAMIERRPYAIAFLELTLDGAIDGLSVCQAIKQMPQPPGGIVPAVVFTAGRTGPSHRVRGSLAGCDAYLNKPLLDDELLTALRDVDPLFR